MAHIEVNAMSVKLFSTFEAEVFFPGLHLEAGERYPVVWFIHPDGTGPVELERYTDLLEGYAEKKKFLSLRRISVIPFVPIWPGEPGMNSLLPKNVPGFSVSCIP